ncbi:uncharacterized protein FOMMEDRAFT_169416 [Fomitiporia mediterranea MF3/22]|uniref:uncharacterized protein n=1 Tax=Fomitiporia mediterranea (strain MF3/22) TaxID=694068 RepID=UPI0004407840|nr:uncharacterized protein FOMMEDRAFT_169416 [Fomitiporia mediterranea MF3/22]EJD01260.1 hypothetical protein FOMMEDRAFT_169416 [Fomitiporia mediterranea MF3/22]
MRCSVGGSCMQPSFCTYNVIPRRVIRFQFQDFPTALNGTSSLEFSRSDRLFCARWRSLSLFTRDPESPKWGLYDNLLAFVSVKKITALDRCSNWAHHGTLLLDVPAINASSTPLQDNINTSIQASP